MITDKQNLLDFIQHGIENNKELLVLGIKNDEMQEVELIVNPYGNFEYKKNYIEKTYDEDLTLKNSKKIKIIDYYFL